MAFVSVVMGSQSDMPTMQNAVDKLVELAIPHEVKIVSAHRTPKRLVEFAENARDNNIDVIIAGAGGAAHLPGMIASLTTVPVIGVPVQSKALKGMDSLLSIVQMPAGIPVATVAIGNAGASNAGLLAASMLSITDTDIRSKLDNFRKQQSGNVKLNPEM